MTALTTAERLAAIRQRWNAVTPGPYRNLGDFVSQQPGPIASQLVEEGHPFYILAIPQWVSSFPNRVGERQALANGDFFAHSWEDIKWLLDQVCGKQERRSR